MAETIQIASSKFQLQSYDGKDTNLISSFDIDTFLNQSGYIEFFIYDINSNLLSADYNFVNYSIGEDNKPEDNIISQLNIDPESNLIDSGFTQGTYITSYNLLYRHLGDQFTKYYISEISSDRTEIRLDNNTITPISIIEETNLFIDFREDKNYFVDFYLNFGNNNLVIANNIKLDDEDTDNPTVLIKLYEPLPSQFSQNDELWVVTTLNEPENYQIDFGFEPELFADSEQISGPNFSIPLKNQVNNSSQNLSYNDLINIAPTSSQNQINSLLSQSDINISVDYTDFNDFIHFSSLQTRIENFYYKVGLIETYTSESNFLINVSSSQASQQIFQNKISNVITNFDKFEYFMYYSSGSEVSYPKSNSTEPYNLLPTTSSQVLTWLGSTDELSSNFGGLLLSASNFDNANPDELKKAIPEYLREDPNNQLYDLFVDMVAQYYDNVWLYTKDITQKYNADNRLDFGVSKDLVADAIRDFGIKLYQNNFSNKELYTAFLGITPNGSLFPFPEITGSLPAPTGFEFVDTLISASNDVISMDDTNKSLYKRIYHNIPYLLKSKGTLAGLRALITSYGIPDTILKISEFGGKDKVNANDYDLYFNNFNYALGVGPDLNFVSSSWEAKPLWDAPNDRASTVQFRFKSEEFPPTNLSQSLWQIQNGPNSAELLLDYSGSGLISGPINGPYSGSIKDPYYQYTNLRFIPDNTQPNISASITLPFYNGDWWSVMVTTDQDSTFNLYAGNKIYNGNDGTSIGYYASASVSGASNARWTGGTKSIFASSSLNFNSYEGFSGSLQEIRYYVPTISESVFKDYIMNPLSIEGNNINSASEELIFRAPLGSELDTRLRTPPHTLKSVHPRITGSLPIIPSFKPPSNSNFYLKVARSFENGGTYHTNTETFFLDQPAAGIKNRTNDKIRSENSVLPSGNVLSPIRSLSQTTEASASYTDNINYLEVAFSPQNQINDDIIGQLGHFNIGDYIGDPRQRFEGTNYPELNELSEEYFKKYIKQYDLVDFVRLIKFFDNSLFKMIKDFIPARTSLASGLVVKQHLLERNKYKQPTVQFPVNELLTGSIKSQRIWDPSTETFYISSSLIEEVNGGAGGMLNQFNSEDFAPGGINDLSITQSWSVTTPSLSGSVTKIHESQDEFYNGEFSGSVILVTNGELNPHCEQFKVPQFIGADYKLRIYYENEGYDESKFLNGVNKPTDGHISLFYGAPPSSVLSPSIPSAPVYSSPPVSS